MPEFPSAGQFIGRFAVVKLWPDVKAAEDECIARLKIAASSIGVECVEITPDGRLLSDPERRIDRQLVDFAIHLHYDTPKCYDAFSFVALWNPLQFYVDFGYERTSRNLISHDDFLSCGSIAADDHVARIVRKAGTPLPARFNLYHSTADVVAPPSLGDRRIFYAGINWDALTRGKSRHQQLLKALDTTGVLRIYGPRIFQGVRVWAGYKSYVGELPFDGVSLIRQISRAGVALVISSEAHKNSALMSNRLFESIAAGALVICDENPFAKANFGDALLYIDTRLPLETVKNDILKHLAWANANPDAATAKIAKAQDIFRSGYTLTSSLRKIYAGLADRKAELAERQNPPGTSQPSVNVYYLMPEYEENSLKAHLRSIAAQEYSHTKAFLVVDRQDTTRLKAALDDGGLPASAELLELEFRTPGIHDGRSFPRKLGEVFLELIAHASTADAFIVVAPNEELLSNHVSVLAGALQRDPTSNCAATSSVLLQENGLALNDIVGFPPAEQWPGLGRFIFRSAAVPSDIAIALRHLDCMMMAALIGDHEVTQVFPATVLLDEDHAFAQRVADLATEQEIVRDFAPAVLEPRYGPFGRQAGERQYPISFQALFRLMMNPRWVKAQYRKVRTKGLASRFAFLRLGLWRAYGPERMRQR